MLGGTCTEPRLQRVVDVHPVVVRLTQFRETLQVRTRRIERGETLAPQCSRVERD